MSDNLVSVNDIIMGLDPVIAERWAARMAD